MALFHIYTDNAAGTLIMLRRFDPQLRRRAERSNAASTERTRSLVINTTLSREQLLAVKGVNSVSEEASD